MDEQKKRCALCKGGAKRKSAAGRRAFGVESSLAAVAGYLPVIILSLVNLKRKC